MSFEVERPIINSAFREPQRYWFIQPGASPELRDGRRPAFVFQPAARDEWDLSDGTIAKLPEYERGFELVLVNRLRTRVKEWRGAGYPGATGTTLDLLQWWTREDREKKLFFAQIEAAETIIFLREARPDFLQGIDVPRDHPGAEKTQQGFQAFLRYACKMATGSGKTVVMGMLAAWSILNKVANRSNGSFSDVVLVVCPNITIRSRLRELDPANGEGSVYWTRDLVPPEYLQLLNRGRVCITNWHVFEPQTLGVAGEASRVVKTGVPVDVEEIIYIGDKNQTARGRRYLTLQDYERQVSAEIFFVQTEERDENGKLKSARVFFRRYIESDRAIVDRVIGREIGGKQNILVFNDEAHHAYRIRQDASEEDDSEALTGTAEDDDVIAQEATVWVDGLDRVNKERGINFCLDLSATPYFLTRAGRDTARPFPWTVSDFGLIDAIESGLVKIPQLAAADTTGAERAKYFNVWSWMMDQLTAAERGPGRTGPKPEAVLKYAAHPISLLAGDWRREFDAWAETGEKRPPVFIIVCKDTRIAKAVYDWIAEDERPTGIPEFGVAELRNQEGTRNTIRVDVKVVAETDTEAAKSDESQWMRFTLDTVGKLYWPLDRQGNSVYPAGFVELAEKLERPLTPPGKEVRCIVSVGMLTEGWDANTVTHIIGLRPFMSQLLCEQVVGRGLRRASYDADDDGLFTEEVAQVFGVPFDVIPFKATGGAPIPKPKRFHVYARDDRGLLEIRFPRVDGFTQSIRSVVSVDWEQVPTLVLRPGTHPTIVSMKNLTVDTSGRPVAAGPGKATELTLDPFRAGLRMQRGIFGMAADLARQYLGQNGATVPAHVLFPQLVNIVERFVRKHVSVPPSTNPLDVFIAPYHVWALEILLSQIRPDTSQGEAPEVPRFETLRPEGSTADVDYWTSKDVRETNKSHVNYVVADTAAWEQQAAFYIDRHPKVAAFVKNAGLGFTIPYFFNGQLHDYVPDFLVRFDARETTHLILETKGYDPLAEIKQAAAIRWVNAVNADGRYGTWAYAMARSVADVSYILTQASEGTLGIAVSLTTTS